MAFSPMRGNFTFRTSYKFWSALDSLGDRWRKLDNILREKGKHDRVLDMAVSTIRGRNVLFPFWYYQDGWGDVTVASSFYAWLDSLRRDIEVQEAWTRTRTWTPRKLNLSFDRPVTHSEGFVTKEAKFRTSALEIDHLIPRESIEGRALFVSPVKETCATRPTVILLAGTGEHGYGRRMSSLAIPLAVQAGISSVILESPFYGSRRPFNQVGSKLRQVSDLAVLGRVTIEETCSLIRFLNEQMDNKNIAIAGVSMGGLHSAMSASLSPQSVGVVSWLGPPSAAPVFTKGLLSRFCEWKRLQKEVGNGAAAKDVMKAFLSLTDIGNFPKPVDPSRGIFVIAENDLYVPTEESISIWHGIQKEKWRGSKVVVVPGGHVSATLFGGSTMRKCIESVLGVRKEDPFLSSTLPVKPL